MNNYIVFNENNLAKEIENFPNPIKVRTKTTLLNGEWDFSFDGNEYTKINVPFCPECELSGVSKQNLTGKCFYKKTFFYSKNNRDLIIHFGAVDYHSILYINNNRITEHLGGYTPFECNITPYIKNGENEILLYVEDKNEGIFSGKQTQTGYSYGCYYSRITGIWQNVWLEEREAEYIDSFKFYPNVNENYVDIELNCSCDGNLGVEVYYNNKVVGSFLGLIKSKETIKIKLNEKHLWNTREGNLYFVKLIFNSDIVYSYFGLREIKFSGLKFFLNNEAVFQKLVLNQGYYKKGIYTPASLDEMQRDIDNTLMLGFNGLRLHQKVFDPRFLYLCDKAGLMVWGEFPSWGVDYTASNWAKQFENEWLSTLNRDFNHPSIVMWCPFNEVWDSDNHRDVEVFDDIYKLTKEFDRTRPCVDVSGGNHTYNTDLFDFHCYEDLNELEKHLDDLDNKNLLNVPLLYSKYDNFPYNGKIPVMLSEFGGIALNSKMNGVFVKTINECAITTTEDWGYGNQETNPEKFVNRYIDLAEVILKCKTLSGFCYTQLYDIEQEQNGFFTYDRTPKLDSFLMEKIKDINSKF